MKPSSQNNVSFRHPIMSISKQEVEEISLSISNSYVEIVVDKSYEMNSKINKNKTFDYINYQLCNMSGYKTHELINEAHTLLQHPDMPKFMNYFLFKRLEKGISTRIIEKYLAKSGAFFWVMTAYKPVVNEKGVSIAYTAQSTKASPYAISTIKRLYQTISKIERKTADSNMSERYLIGYLENLNHSYDSFMEELTLSSTQYEFSQELSNSIREGILKEKISLEKQSRIKKLRYDASQDIFRKGA